MLDKAQFVGKWPSILAALGVDKRFLVNRHGPCPICNEGKDRFRFDDKDGDGTWFCSHCGAGDGFALAMAVLRLDFKEALARVANVAGTASLTAPKISRTEEQNRQAMKSMWQGSRPIQTSDAAGLYLARRLGCVPFSPMLRFAPRIAYHREQPNIRPAMIAKVIAPDSLSSTIHRTFLTSDGRKAPGDAPRRLMPGKMAPGSAIRLEAATTVLGVAEGIETAWSASLIFGLPVWALINADNLEAFQVPPHIKEFWIFGDNDMNFVGQAAAYRLARKSKMKRSDLTVRVEIPSTAGDDWNDVHRELGFAQMPAAVEGRVA